MSHNHTDTKRLIEVDQPIKKISEHIRRGKSISHGHISTLHIELFCVLRFGLIQPIHFVQNHLLYS